VRKSLLFCGIEILPANSLDNTRSCAKATSVAFFQQFSAVACHPALRQSVTLRRKRKSTRLVKRVGEAFYGEALIGGSAMDAARVFQVLHLGRTHNSGLLHAFA